MPYGGGYLGASPAGVVPLDAASLSSRLSVVERGTAQAISGTTYDGDGNLLTIAVDGHTTTMTYNADGTVATVTYPDSTVQTFTYDSQGRIASAAVS